MWNVQLRKREERFAQEETACMKDIYHCAEWRARMTTWLEEQEKKVQRRREVEDALIVKRLHQILENSDACGDLDLVVLSKQLEAELKLKTGSLRYFNAFIRAEIEKWMKAQISEGVSPKMQLLTENYDTCGASGSADPSADPSYDADFLDGMCESIKNTQGMMNEIMSETGAATQEAALDSFAPAMMEMIKTSTSGKIDDPEAFAEALKAKFREEQVKKEEAALQWRKQVEDVVIAKRIRQIIENCDPGSLDKLSTGDIQTQVEADLNISVDADRRDLKVRVTMQHIMDKTGMDKSFQSHMHDVLRKASEVCAEEEKKEGSGQVKDLTPLEAAEQGCLDTLKRLHRRGLVIGEDFVCEAAAKGGQLEVLKWLHKVGYPWNPNTCAYAAQGGHLKILQWLRANDCPWGPVTCVWAAEYGHFELLKWARKNDSP